LFGKEDYHSLVLAGVTGLILLSKQWYFRVTLCPFEGKGVNS